MTKTRRPSLSRKTDCSADIRALLSRAVTRYGREGLSNRLGRTPKTISRWMTGTTPPPKMLHHALEGLFVAESRPHYGPPAFTFVDLFAGIGGIRLGFEAFGGRCVFTSEWDSFSQKTYRANFKDEHEIFGDITTLDAPARQMPDFDVLLAGFPCQPFSIAGVSKKNALGRPHGFACEAQGTLFFDVARIIKAKQPKAFLLENVKNLVGHDKGNTFRVIRDVLEHQLGYSIHYKVIDAQHFVPQHRERILIVGYREPRPFDWSQVNLPEKGLRRMRDILHPQNGSEKAEPPFTEGASASVSARYVLTDHLWRYLRDYAAKHRAAGNGFGFGLVEGGSVARTLSARYYKDGSEILVSRGEGKNPRRLTPRECARLMGYPDDFQISVSDTQAYRQFGNSVVVPVIKAVAGPMVAAMHRSAEEVPSTPGQLELFGQRRQRRIARAG
jgi:DNA (cytosine-5)-methyltransferase 1